MVGPKVIHEPRGDQCHYQPTRACYRCFLILMRKKYFVKIGLTGASFPACFASLVSQDYVNGTDQEEIRTGVDQCIQKFLDVARQTECFFLQKRLQLSVQKPDQVIKEDVSELRNELQRKETLIQKHLGKLRHWQQVLDDINIQQKKPTEMPQGPLAYLEQASANIPAPLKQI
uniref:Mediator of RNA polymerase II transcription subunit 28 n=1 Tax=Laticauda laticaudata TaxID=8630 RepID=A0A8C5WT96_LATLA